ncbi:hypothetical protein BC939DRAFT_433729 [Gamsiella multidivaricata]|uniref:uncharacterized protein n=1 Tax=Gamsiella multidivaricata TaxID=101098 RepID=UPI00221EEEFA|nr:uncharacterized protein BC939DRAFT_433729 [Gamsiella multidivaricata]KAI7832551.1 hypothetical protein BC939DRAFT_433729 [Gamsiella multidivaricata]
MTMPRKLGTLVAIPIKGRMLLNRSGGKQSPYVQLRLGADQKKRTKASLIASLEPEWDQEIRLDVYQGCLAMRVSVVDEGKKDELVGEGTLLLHEVLDRGELDVWFPIKHKGAIHAGDIYFELTFYALAPPPHPQQHPPQPQQPLQAGARPLPHPQQHQTIPHPAIRHTQPGYSNAHPGRLLPHAPPVNMFNRTTPGPPAQYSGNTYHHPAAYVGHHGTGTHNNHAQPHPLTHQRSFPSPQPSPPPPPPTITTPITATAAIAPFGNSTRPTVPGHRPSSSLPTSFGPTPSLMAFKPKTKYTGPNHQRPQQQQQQQQQQTFQNGNNGRQQQLQHPSPGGCPGLQTNIGNRLNQGQQQGCITGSGSNQPRPIPTTGHAHGPPGHGHGHGQRSMTPLVQYNYTLGSFP